MELLATFMDNANGLNYLAYDTRSHTLFNTLLNRSIIGLTVWHYFRREYSGQWRSEGSFPRLHAVVPTEQYTGAVLACSQLHTQADVFHWVWTGKFEEINFNFYCITGVEFHIDWQYYRSLFCDCPHFIDVNFVRENMIKYKITFTVITAILGDIYSQWLVIPSTGTETKYTLF